jgi:hypothetical protein
MPITREQAVTAVRDACANDGWHELIVEDVLRIVNDGQKYPDRGLTQELRIPEDFSTGIALCSFGVNAYMGGT